MLRIKPLLATERVNPCGGASLWIIDKFPVCSFSSNCAPSNGSFTFPAHGEPGQGSADRQSSVLAGKLLFCDCPFLPMSSPFSMLQQIQITAPCPVSSETGFFLQPAGGDEILDGALDGGFGQTCVAGNGRNRREAGADRKSTRLNSSHREKSRMPSSA